ncbi:MAG: hypothetical protein KC587_08425 [Nitrospira sp.]|nr:hypothetical protein [Nitrospira sp.]MCW5783312.1 hypothetical protein [Nitrospirales bacterium]
MKFERIKNKKPPPVHEAKQEVILAISKYMLGNPNAKDTEEGVKKWWMEGKFSKEEIRSGLHWFVEKEWILKRLLPGGNQVFCMNPDHKQDVLNYLKEQDR